MVTNLWSEKITSPEHLKNAMEMLNSVQTTANSRSTEIAEFGIIYL